MIEVRSIAPLSDVLLIQTKVHGDARGFFLESFNQRDFMQATGIKAEFVQDNHSRSDAGVLRGLHYQLAPHAQGKLVRVARGAIFDVAVDLRRHSPGFGQWAGCTLREADGQSIWIPPGFGHGFLVLEDGTDVLYKTTDYYAPDCEASIIWNDPDLNIQWPEAFTADRLLLSEKDLSAAWFKNAKVFD